MRKLKRILAFLAFPTSCLLLFVGAGFIAVAVAVALQKIEGGQFAAALLGLPIAWLGCIVMEGAHCLAMKSHDLVIKAAQ
jgi:membrane protease YdiL (CAAX protease family)